MIESENISSHVHSTLLYLLIAASCALLISICLILPVAMQVDKDKDALLRNFMLIDREDVKKQLEKCRVFFNTMHDKDPNAIMIDGQEEEPIEDGVPDGS